MYLAAIVPLPMHGGIWGWCLTVSTVFGRLRQGVQVQQGSFVRLSSTGSTVELVRPGIAWLLTSRFLLHLCRAEKNIKSHPWKISIFVLCCYEAPARTRGCLSCDNRLMRPQPPLPSSPPPDYTDFFRKHPQCSLALIRRDHPKTEPRLGTRLHN